MNNKQFSSATLTVEIVDTLRRYPMSDSGIHNYYIYFEECLIGGDSDDEYELDKKDVDRFANALTNVIENGEMDSMSGASDYCVYNTLTVRMEDGRELWPIKWCGYEEEEDPNPIHREFYESLHKLIDQWH